MVIPRHSSAGPSAELRRSAASRIMNQTKRSLLWLALGLIAVAFVLGWYLLRFDPMFGFGTRYAVGYSELRFASLKRGMTESEVESVMGAPISRGSFFDQGVVWMYSKQPNPTSNFFRRWVVFKDGKADLILNDYWWD